jgi:hypothetical protein
VAGGSKLGLTQWPISDINFDTGRDSITLFYYQLCRLLGSRPGACNDVLKVCVHT